MALCIVMVSLLSASEHHEVAQPSASLKRLVLRLDKGLFTGTYRDKKGIEDGQLVPVVLHVNARGTSCTSGWAIAEELGGFGRTVNHQERRDYVLETPLSIDVHTLHCDDHSISGSVTRWHLRNSRPFDAEVWTIEARIEGDAIRGTFSCQRPVGDLRWLGKSIRYEGVVTGEILQGQGLDALGKNNAFAPAASWPSLGGPTANARAYPAEQALVDKWEDARFVWKAELNLVPGSPNMGHPGGGTRYDYNGPIMADGKVFFFTAEPVQDGPRWGTAEFRQRIEQQPQGKRQYAWISALLMNEVCYAFDARTGAQLWRAVFPRRSVTGNASGKGKGGHWSTPAYKDGLLICCGGQGWVYCLEAETGRLKWQRLLTPGAMQALTERVQGLGADDLVTHLGDFHNNLQISPCIADGIVVCAAQPPKSFRAEGGLYGLDITDGTIKWGPIALPVSFGQPVCWQVGNQELVLTPDVRCLRPQSGEVIWEARHNKGRHFLGAINANGLFLNRSTGSKGSKDPAIRGPILKITPETARLHAHVPVAGGALEASGVGTACDDNDNFIYWMDHGKDDKRGRGIIIIDQDGQELARHISGQSHVVGYHALVYSGGRIFCAQGSNGIRMFKWDAAGKSLSFQGLLRVGYYWESPLVLVEGRMFFRMTDGIACYDLRRLVESKQLMKE